MKTKIIFLILFLSAFFSAMSQVAISTDNSLPDPSSGLDIKFVNKGFLPPRLTQAQRDAILSPAEGLMVICTDCGNPDPIVLSIFLNGAWRLFTNYCATPGLPVAGTHLCGPYQIIWNWNPVPGATGYKWSNTNNFATALDLGGATSKSETGLTCESNFTRYIWAYNMCGESLSLVTSASTTSCYICGQPYTDLRDGKIYQTVQVGSQCWFAQNLNVGTKILNSQNQADNDFIEKYCYNDDETKCDVYGGLYIWNELMDYTTASSANPSGREGICPAGWHLPSDAEWCQMEYFLDATVNCSATGWIGTNAGGKMKEAGLVHWANPNTGATNSSGLTFLPGGYRETTGGYYSIFISGNFWTTAEYNSENAYNRGLGYANAGSYRSYGPKPAGFSARCCKD